jgi:hypothetical protein
MLAGCAHRHRLALRQAAQDGVGAEILARLDGGGHGHVRGTLVVLAGGRERQTDVFGPDAQRRCTGCRLDAAGLSDRHQLQHVHRRRPDEPRGERRRGAGVQDVGRGILLDAAVAHQDDLVRHAHRLGLVVRHIDHRDTQLALQRVDLAPHLLTKLRVQVRQGFVHQADRLLGNDRAAKGDPLLLAAGELSRLPIEQAVEPEKAGDPCQPGSETGGRLPAHLDAEEDVLGDTQVRKQGVGLEHHRDPPPRRRQVRHVDAVDQDPSRHRNIEAGDQPQRRGFAASRRSQQDDKASGRRGEADVVDGQVTAPLAADVLELDRGHARAALKRCRMLPERIFSQVLA